MSTIWLLYIGLSSKYNHMVWFSD